MTSNFEFTYSAVSYDKLPPQYFKEILILGRSNVGKSSFINSITNSAIAISSRTPGRTKALNFFTSKTKNTTIIDSPGYGFAKANAKMQDSWTTMIEHTLQRDKLIHIIVLIDARRGLMNTDISLLNILAQANLPITLITTKNDKKEAKAISPEELKGFGDITLFNISNKKQTDIAKVKKYLKL